MNSANPPRYRPDLALPPYAYLSGHFPHPIRDPAGHAYGRPHEPATWDETRWQDSASYLAAVDLFNHGYSWEAHETWEGLWLSVGRSGTAAQFFLGLIKLAAAGVKIREQRPDGVRRHAARALAHFQQVIDALAERGLPPEYGGLSLTQLQSWASDLERDPPRFDMPPETPVVIVFPFVLRLSGLA